jgi:uncharacterized protein (TIGR00106 family)
VAAGDSRRPLPASGQRPRVVCDDPGMIAAFSITPLGVGASVSGAVAESVRIVRESGLANETNAMFTNVEGDWDEVMALIKACVLQTADQAQRVSVVIKLDYRPGTTDAMAHKVEVVEQHLARQHDADATPRAGGA